MWWKTQFLFIHLSRVRFYLVYFSDFWDQKTSEWKKCEILQKNFLHRIIEHPQVEGAQQGFPSPTPGSTQHLPEIFAIHAACCPACPAGKVLQLSGSFHLHNYLSPTDFFSTPIGKTIIQVCPNLGEGNTLSLRATLLRIQDAITKSASVVHCLDHVNPSPTALLELLQGISMAWEPGRDEALHTRS